MILDYQLREALALEFLRRYVENYITGTLLPGNGTTVLGSSTSKFSALHVENLYADSLVASGTSADMVDGLHASTTPRPNQLLALDANARFPSSVLGDLLTLEGGTLTGHLNAAAGILIDGVDISVFKAQFDAHDSQTAIQAHGAIGPHDHRTSGEGGDLTQYASADGQGFRSAYRAERLRRYISVGNGLSGGGMLDQDVNLRVNAGAGLSFTAQGALQLTLPGTLSAASINRSTTNHTHAVTASEDPTGASLLKSGSTGGLRLRQFAVGDVALPGVGHLRASGDIRGNRIVSDADAFVGSNLSVGVNVLNVVSTRDTVYVNREEDNPPLSGALTVRPGQASQRGVLIQGKVGQEPTAPLLAVADADGHDVFRVGSDGTVESGNPAFVSGLKGWRISGEGDAEFRNIVARGELHTSVFVANEMHATGGTMAVMTTGIVDTPLQTTDNLVDTTFNLIVSGDPNLPGVCAFGQNDVLRVKLITGLQEN